MIARESMNLMQRAVQSCISGNLHEGERLLRQFLLTAPASADGWFNLGKVLRDLGRLQESAEAYRTAAALQPNDADVLYNLGNVLCDLRLPAEALTAYRKGVEVNPHHPGLLTNLGRAFEETGDRREALLWYRHAVEESPGFGPAHMSLGHALLRSGRAEDAEQCYRRAIACDPEVAESHYNLAGALLEEDRYAEADWEFGEALRLRPEFSEALVNRGIGYLLTERIQDARDACMQAIVFQPECAEAHLNLAVALLQAGAYPEGWPEYEWRFRTADGQNPRRYPHIPEWSGSPVAGKTVLVYQEQGLGDMLQCARFLPLLARQGASVAVACQPALHALLRGSPGVTRIVGVDEQDVAADYVCPVFSLPRLFGVTQTTIPAEVPYLCVSSELVEQWRKRVPPETGTIRAGFAWRGNPAHTNNRRRSLPESAMEMLLTTEGVQFHSLHSGSNPGIRFPGLSFHADMVHDFAEVAALMQALDLVITVDTSFAHLAGGLGVPVWLLLNYGGDWRWLLARSDSPWYPTMRIFRQPQPGDWMAVILEVQQALRTRAWEKHR